MAGSEEYPYPSHVFAPSFVTVKLSGRNMYNVWETQMLCLLESHDMLAFIRPADNMSTVKGKEKEGDYLLWRRSDALVKGWILGSLSQQTLNHVISNPDFTAKDIWDKLRTIYGPRLQYQPTKADYDPDIEERSKTKEETIKEEEKKLRKDDQEKDNLRWAILEGDFHWVEKILSNKVVTMRDKININGNTALHVAVGTTKDKVFLQKMIYLATQSDQPLATLKNSEGSTPLHVAAIVGNTEAAKMLVEANEDLLFAEDNEGQTPVARALSNMHTDTYLFLLDSYIKFGDVEKHDLFDGGDLMVNMISSKNYHSARKLFLRNKLSPSSIGTVLMAIAQNFPPKLTFWENVINSGDVQTKLKFVKATQRKEEAYSFAELLLTDICDFIWRETEFRLRHDYYNNAILEATRQNEDEFVKEIVFWFQDAIWSTNEDGYNIIQYAVINRSEKVYNLLYQMSEHKNIYRTIKDPLGNNLLHLAARLAPANRLNSVSGAALQIQYELQWFREVKGFVCPLNVIQKNSFGETPEMIFTKEHKELVIEGEKWMKATAESYTITAALITTIVFAAAIIVPGGNKQEDGIPVFSNHSAFTIFAVSDAISLFTSVTSLLMFLSILTARFSEQDFLLKLPRKLIIGLASLFISTTAMLVAFGATLFLVFGRNNSLTLVPIAALTCLPITSFLTLQFPLIYDLISATYGRSMFGKKDDSPFY